MVAKSAIVSQQGESEAYQSSLWEDPQTDAGTTDSMVSSHYSPHPFLLLPAEDRTQDRRSCSHHPVTQATSRVGAKTLSGRA